MRTILKSPEPHALTTWRAANQADLNFGYDLLRDPVKRVVKDALLREQLSLCAYTGLRIDDDRSHVEHLLPQKHCARGKDVEYANLVACYPGPTMARVPYGAQRKDHWPSVGEWGSFVSPLDQGCERRFVFARNGRVAAATPGDLAAESTIHRLGLNEVGLSEQRKAAMAAVVGIPRKGIALDLKAAKKRLAGLISAEASTGPLEPFCFALKQALERHIRRLGNIR